MVNEKVYIFDQDNIQINVYEQSSTEVNVIPETEPEIIYLFEPGPQGPKGNDGGEFILPTNVVSGSDQLSGSFDLRYELQGSNIISSSQQISSDISGSFTNLSSSLAGRIFVFENKTLFSSSQQVDYNSIQNVPADILSSSQTFVLKTEFYPYSSSTDTKINRLEQQTSSYAQISILSHLFDFTSSTNQRLQIIEQATSSYVRNDSTASFVTTQSFNSYTGSVDTKVQRLEQVTSSFAVKTEISGAFGNVSGSLSQRIEVFENKTLLSGSSQVQYLQITGIPSGLFSSSAQVDYNSIQNKPTTILSASYALTASYVSGSSSNSVTSSYALTASYVQLPFGLISGSEQLTGSYDLRYERKGSGILSSSNGFISSSNQIASDISGSFVSASNSLSGRIGLFESKTLFSGSQQVIYSQISSIPTNIVSGSDQLSSSYDQKYELKGRNVISGSEQLTGSYDLRYERKGTGLLSSSNQISTDISGSFISSSNSLSGRINVFETKTLYSSSQQVDYNLIQNQPTTIPTASYALTASFALNAGSSGNINTGSFATTGSNIFIGNQTITGSLTVSQPITGSILSSSYALSASYSPPQISSSYAQTSSFSPNIQTIGIKIKTEDNYITQGSKGYRHIGYNSNINKIRTIANTSGNIDINVKNNGLIIGTVSLLNQSSSLDTTLTNWTSSLNTNDLLEFYVSQSSTYITDITLFMDIQSI